MRIGFDFRPPGKTDATFHHTSQQLQGAYLSPAERQERVETQRVEAGMDIGSSLLFSRHAAAGALPLHLVSG